MPKRKSEPRNRKPQTNNNAQAQNESNTQQQNRSAESRKEGRKKHPRTRTLHKRFVILLIVFAIGVIGGAFYAHKVTDHTDLAFLRNLVDTFHLTDLQILPEITSGDTYNFFAGKDLRQFIPRTVPWKSSEKRPGQLLAEQGLRAKYPVVLLPGLVTTGLEIWSGEACAMKYFRQRMWGTLTMVQTMLLQPECWLQHMALDIGTGLDPEGKKLRPAAGFEAADYLMPGYWVWYKMIENLADVGYDNNNMVMATYDWRLSPQNLEKRDKFFTRLKTSIETLRAGGEKVVVLAHSLGANGFLYFLQWVESPEGGKGGQSWVDHHIHSFVNIAGPLLGVPKAVSALLSGEMKDTAQLGALESYLTGTFTATARRSLFQTWYSLAWLLPRGGTPIWGDAPPVTFTDGSPALSHEGVIDVLRTNFSGEFGSNIDRWFSFPAAPLTGPAIPDSKTWTNALGSRLPAAPNVTIFCLYGVGKPTETAYFYRPSATDSKFPYVIDKSHSITGQSTTNGVVFTDGDGTVPLLSLGYLCAPKFGGWRRTGLNPSAIRVVLKEYQHEVGWELRGPKTGDHVDIMGNTELTTDALLIAVGAQKRVKERVFSPIEEIAAAVTARLLPQS